MRHILALITDITAIIGAINLQSITIASSTDDLTQMYQTCADWMTSHEQGELTDGVYNITSNIIRNGYTDTWRNVYCSFDYTRNYAWTLFESGSRSTMTTTLQKSTFVPDLPYNEDEVETYRNSLYRLSRDWIYSLYYQSDYLFSTCEFDTSFSQDWLLLDISDLSSTYNPFFDEFAGICTTVLSANIRGHLCQDDTLPLWTIDGTYHLHIDSTYTTCNCDGWTTDAYTSEDNFGFYAYNSVNSGTFNTEFTCTASSSSTTNWWLGSLVNSYKIPTKEPTNMPTAQPTRVPITPTEIPSINPTNTPTVEPTMQPTMGPSVDPTVEPSKLPTVHPVMVPTYSEEVIACMEQCTDNTTDLSDSTQFSSTVGTDTAVMRPTAVPTVNNNDIIIDIETSEVDDGAAGETSSKTGTGGTGTDALSTEFIVVVAVVCGVVILCCVFCMFVTCLVSRYFKKQPRGQRVQHVHVQEQSSGMMPPMENVSSLSYVNGMNGMNRMNSTNSMRMGSTNSIPGSDNNMNNNHNNGGAGGASGGASGPNISWQELAAIHALTSKAMNTMNNNINTMNANGQLQTGSLNKAMIGENDENIIGNGDGNVGGNGGSENDELAMDMAIDNSQQVQMQLQMGAGAGAAGGGNIVKQNVNDNELLSEGGPN